MSIVVPDGWEAIVKGPCHLIFERALRPCLEIRWECPASRHHRPPSPDRIVSDLLRQAIGRRPRLEAVQDTGHLSPSFVLQAFSANGSGAPDLLVLTCKTCGMVALLRCYPENLAASHLQPLLSTIDCQHRRSGPSRWCIQDLSFMLPSDYSLARYSFAFGLTSLSFTCTTGELHLCRLAPASEHLRRASIETLFARFSGITQHAPERIDASTLRCRSTPGTWVSLLKRIFRRRPYRWAQLQHLPENDRILGVLLDSYRPLDAETIAAFEGLLCHHSPQKKGSGHPP